ncbi:hypothetical protein [Streptomyces sp. NPDC051636]|uniref:hypothetical protein n=1 Tax=Streptomyces sp. NPDC051636 TaxID=3365663 RepID=UPI0037ABE892
MASGSRPVKAAARFIEEGGNAVVTEDLREALGRPARTYRQWAEDHRPAFVPA